MTSSQRALFALHFDVYPGGGARVRQVFMGADARALVTKAYIFAGWLEPGDAAMVRVVRLDTGVVVFMAGMTGAGGWSCVIDQLEDEC